MLINENKGGKDLKFGYTIIMVVFSVLHSDGNLNWMNFVVGYIINLNVTFIIPAV